MVPYRVPKLTQDQSEQDPLTTTRCLSPTRNCRIQLSKLPSMPLHFNFKSSCSCGTLSKVLARSRKITSVGTDRFGDFAQSLNMITQKAGLVVVDKINFAPVLKTIFSTNLTSNWSKSNWVVVFSQRVRTSCVEVWYLHVCIHQVEGQ